LVNAYPVALAAGVLLGALWIGWTGRTDAGSATETPIQIEAGLTALLLGLLGARLAYVGAYWSYYGSRLVEAAQFWEGGLSWAGAAVGAAIGLAGYSTIVGRSFWNVADSLAIPATIVAASSWFGCLLDACAYGQRASGGPSLPDMLGVLAPRWPTQALGGIISLLAVGALYRLSQFKLQSGVLACAAISLVAAISLGLAFLRGDPSPVIVGMRADGLASGALLALGIIGLVMRR
jgi:prolipoprotein diacylglyceryltransferase